MKGRAKGNVIARSAHAKPRITFVCVSFPFIRRSPDFRCGIASVQALRIPPSTLLYKLSHVNSPASGGGILQQRTIWGGGIALAILLLAAVYFMFLRAPAVQVMAPTRGMAVEAVYATGTVEPISYARVGTKISGRLTEVVAREGATVEAGNVLAVIDAREEISRVQELRARLQLAASELERTRTLRRSGHVSAAVLDQMETAHAAAIAALQGAQARLDEHFITAPIAGTVLRSENQLKIGDMAQPGQVLFLVGDAAALQIDAEVDEEDILKVDMGQEALIRADAFAGQVLEGSVSGITPHGDPVARTYRVYIGLPDDTPLVSGMTTEINIVVRREENALLVPLSSITGGAVWVVEGGRVQLRPVTLGAVGNTEAEIRSGLSDDDTIVVNPAAGIAEGGRVRPNDVDRE
ncbi:MAG: efflux transporter periplasmic adaptor subunit [Alphaproteobacteria bacterium HGW-Alphaproteobacteria-11]|nr:MAG: efflux transporter periplasmic adaptor subunit [Alphaproteobacteria bacterium HGW-Alphaproteobacteria-11]